MNSLEENQEWLRNNSKFVNQWRSWYIMGEYFGIVQPGVVGVELKLPEELQKALDSTAPEIKKMKNDWERKQIQGN